MRLLLCAVGLLFGFALIEGGLRLFFDVTDVPRSTWDVSLGIRTDGNQRGRYVSDDYAVDYSYNSLGWNQPREYTPIRKPGATRIAVVGDSFVEALHVRHDDTFFGRAERRMTEQGRPCEWYSFGVSGYGTGAEYMLIRNHVLDFSPDLTILLFIGNDVMDTSPYLRGVNPWDTVFLLDGRGNLQLAPTEPFRPNKLKRWLGKSALVRYLYYQKRWFRPRNRRFAAVANQTTLKELDRRHGQRFADLVPQDLSDNDRGRLSWQVVEKLLVAMRDECNRRGSKFLLLWGGNRSVIRGAIAGETSASTPQAEDPWCLGPRIHEQGELLSAIAERHSIPFLDLTDALVGYAKKTGQNVYFEHDGHWSRRGHQAVADAIQPIVEDLLR